VTVRGWLRDRSPEPPARLAARIEEALGERGEHGDADVAECCVSAADELLRDLLARPSAGRESALDLLTVDALVTYAFEAATSEPETLVQRANDAMVRLAAGALE
jgi:hypothetical protein